MKTYYTLSLHEQEVVRFLKRANPSEFILSSYKNKTAHFKYQNNHIYFYLNSEKKIKYIGVILFHEGLYTSTDLTKYSYNEAEDVIKPSWEKFHDHFYHQLRLRMLFG